MTLPVLAPDTQNTWAPVWILKVGPFGETAGLTAEPGAIGADFVGGVSETFTQAFATRDLDTFPTFVDGRILNGTEITVQRHMGDTRWGVIVTDDVSVTLWNGDGAIGDLRASAVKLDRYDAVSGLVTTEFTGVIEEQSEDRGTVTLILHSVEPSVLETIIPVRLVEIATYPLAVDIGMPIPWLFGRPYGVPLPYVREDLTGSLFDYLVGLGQLGVVGLYRTSQNATKFVASFTECEPAHGILGANLGMETWTGGPTVAPDGWTLTGAGASVAKDTTGAEIHGALASASLTRSGADANLLQDLATIDPAFPLVWWRGRKVQLRGWVRATVASRAQILLNDGVTEPASGFHTGGSAFELLTVSMTLDPSATQVLIIDRVQNGDTTAQFDDFSITVSAKSWAEVGRTDLYGGRTAVRMIARQVDSGGTRFQLTADCIGLLPERNAARAVRRILSDTTSGLGKAVDDPSFDQAEVDAAFSYQDLCAPDNPQVLIQFDERSSVARDWSGYERHGTYNQIPIQPAAGLTNQATGAGSSGDNGDYALQSLIADPSETFVTIPYVSAFDPVNNSIELDIWYRPNAITVQRPICSKLVGTAFGSGQLLYQDPIDATTAQIIFQVHTNTGDFGVTGLIHDYDVLTWMHLVGSASGGVLRLWRDGVLQASKAFTGTLASGPGDVLIGKFGTGGSNRANGWFDNFSLYTTPTGPGRVGARALGRNYPPTGPPLYGESIAFFSPTPDFYFPLGESSGSVMVNYLGLAGNGAYVGTPHFGAVSGVNPLRAVMPYNVGGVQGQGTGISFENDLAIYGKVTTPSLSGTGLTVMALYKPDLLVANSGILEKTIGGATNTSWLLFQEGQEIIFRVKDNAAALQQVALTLRQEDLGRYMFLAASYNSGTLKLYRNGELVKTGSYASPVATGSGDLVLGRLGTIYPCQGDLDEVVIWSGSALSDDNIAAFYVSGVWGPGGLMVDLAMLKQEQAQKIIAQILSLRSMRLGVTTAGAYTLRVDSVARDTIRLALRDGPGDGDRTLIEISGRRHPKDADMVKDLILQYRPNLLKGEPLRTITRSVSPFGADLTVPLDVIREDISADRVADFMSKRLKNDETVETQITQEGRQIGEGDLVTLSYAPLGYAGDTLEVRTLSKGLMKITASVAAWTDAPYTYEPGPFPIGGTSG